MSLAKQVLIYVIAYSQKLTRRKSDFSRILKSFDKVPPVFWLLNSKVQYSATFSLFWGNNCGLHFISNLFKGMSQGFFLSELHKKV